MTCVHIIFYHGLRVCRRLCRWGRLENLLPRREERLSIVFAFADCLDDNDTAGEQRNSNDVSSKETREAEVQATTTHQ